jgi:putative hemolysin
MGHTYNNSLNDSVSIQINYQPVQAPSLQVTIATSLEEVIEAQKLRFNVFAGEYGAHLPGNGIDHDVFDNYCDHLIVRDLEIGRVVGTYRILPPHRARKIGCLYSDSEFFLNRLDGLRDNLVEVGRSCVDADYRTGAVIMLLWSGLAQYMKQGRYSYLMGCASVGLRDGGYQAASLYKNVLQDHLADIEYQAFPKHRLPIERLSCDIDVEAPPLIKGYLRLGAKICGEPAWDPDFNTADFLMLLSIRKLNARYARHFGFV